MKQILIISGKGGTGKTTMASALADLSSHEKRIVLADADVDAANLELLLEPEKQETFAFQAGKTVSIDQDLCIQCGRCEEVCRFEAVDYTENNDYIINGQMCEGCLSCVHQCPEEAITAAERISGEWYRSATPYGILFHAFLFPGEENSGKLVTEIRTGAEEFAERSSAQLLLIDGPPGIGCPVTASIRGVDAAIIVSEPTVSRQHDLERILKVADHFRVPSLLILNKFDLNQEIRNQMIAFTEKKQIPLLGEIPYDERIIHALALGKPVTKTLDRSFSNYYQKIWEKLKSYLRDGVD